LRKIPLAAQERLFSRFSLALLESESSFPYPTVIVLSHCFRHRQRVVKGHRLVSLVTYGRRTHSYITCLANRVSSAKSSMDLFLFTTSAAVFRNYVFQKRFASTQTKELTYELLKRQNADTSNAIIYHYATSSLFGRLATYEGSLTMTRDREDGDKLQKGIDLAKQKGVIDPKFVPQPYTSIDVLNKSPEQVADSILRSVRRKSSKTDQGSIIVIVGLSGTGKGTTVSKLRQKLEAENKKVVTWSNGNIFRSVTLLAATYCEKYNMATIHQVMQKDNLESFMQMLSFDEFDGQYDTRIHGLGLDMLISKVQNKELKGPKVSKNIPTVAEYTQGEVILFAAKAVQKLQEAGYVVLLEGREQTVNYVPTPHRFELILSDDTLIGKRRAAQRMMAAALEQIEGKEPKTTSAVEEALDDVLDRMVKEII